MAGPAQHFLLGHVHAGQERPVGHHRPKERFRLILVGQADDFPPPEQVAGVMAHRRSLVGSIAVIPAVGPENAAKASDAHGGLADDDGSKRSAAVVRLPGGDDVGCGERPAGSGYPEFPSGGAEENVVHGYAPVNGVHLIGLQGEFDGRRGGNSRAGIVFPHVLPIEIVIGAGARSPEGVRHVVGAGENEPLLEEQADAGIVVRPREGVVGRLGRLKRDEGKVVIVERRPIRLADWVEAQALIGIGRSVDAKAHGAGNSRPGQS